MSDVLEKIRSRRSVRRYKSEMVPQEVLDIILEAGTYAATGMGAQSSIIIAVTNKETRDRLSKLNASVMGTDSDPFYGAPMVQIFICILLSREKCAKHGFSQFSPFKRSLAYYCLI